MLDFLLTVLKAVLRVREPSGTRVREIRIPDVPTMPPQEPVTLDRPATSTPSEKLVRTDAPMGLRPPFDPEDVTDGIRISSPYGPRVHPTTGEVGKFHNGVDIPVPIGVPVRSAPGVVAKVWVDDPLNGNACQIDHGDCRSSFVHLDALLVEAGDRVKDGQIVGLSGNTGRSTGPHLHFTVWEEDNGGLASVDPREAVDWSSLDVRWPGDSQ